MLRSSILSAVVLIAAIAIVSRPAHADGVTTCTKASALNTDVMNCLDALVYQPLPIAQTTLVLVCPQGSPGLQDQAQCLGNIWKPLSSITDPGTLIGYCAQAQLTPFAACNYPGGNEGYRLYSDIFGAAPAPPAGSVTGPAQLSWTAPALDINGIPVTIASYLIQYGTTDFSQSVTTTATTYTFSALAAGTWQFEIIAIDVAGERSAPSLPVTLTISGDQTCGAAPAIATQTVACPAGTTGSWIQTHGWSPVAYPTCWTANAWTPTKAPAGACTAVSKTWKTKASESVYEAVLPLTGSSVVRGNGEGTIAAGKPCGAEQFNLSGVSYRTVSDADASLNSPTYQGRNNTAVCTLQ